MALNDGCLDELLAELSQDNFENFSNFRMETNLLRAHAGQEAISVKEALLYLKPCGFQCSKALEVYKYYQKSRETYQLSNLRPYREPLCSGIGANKMEVVGTQDSEGYPIVLFTVSRHETFKSDHKADMQLLFYTLDQVSLIEAAQEKGIVFIIDYRDSQVSDIRYTSSVVSVLNGGYPIHTKDIYVVSHKRLNKAINALQKMLNHKVKYIDFTELSLHFLPEQLPLSLGGSYVPRMSSPVHGLVGVTRDDSAVVSKRSPPQMRRGSDGSRTSREGPHPSPGGGKSVNKMLGLFEGGHDSQPSKPIPPPSPSKIRPIPPVKPTAVKKGTTQPSIQPLKKLQLYDGEAWGKTKVPLLPPNGRVGMAKPDSPGKVAVFAQKNDADGSRGHGVLSKTQAFGGEVKKKVLQKITTSHDETSSRYKRNGNASDKLSTSYSSQPKVSIDRKRADSADQAKPPKGQEVSSPIRTPRIPLPYSGGGSSVGGEKKGDSVGDKKGSVGGEKKGGSVGDKKGSVGGDKEGSVGDKKVPSASPKITTTLPHTLKKAKPTGYENVQPSHVKPPLPHSPPKPLSQEDFEYENMSFSNRDSDVYENIGIGFAGTGDHVTGPLPPLPLIKQPVRQSYENVHLGKSPARDRRREESKKEVMEDDETLFGKEGPPGMQEMIYENFGPDKGDRLMTIEELAAHVEKLGKKGLSTEYYRVRNEPISGLHKACRLPGNTPKNRYKDVICYDETRVQVKSSPSSDYIHANYVDGYKKPKAFILTQGPKDKTVVDFWRMMWEEQVAVVVMVTKCVELGKRKCAQYWPESDSGSAKHGHYSITVANVHSCEGYDVRTLKLTYKGSERTLTHFQFLAWPDYGIPTSGSSILSLIFAVREAQDKLSVQGTCQPIVVHCSAGVGRSGAFCTIDNCIHEVDKLKKVNLQATVRKMRKQRAFAVQTEEQYEFCYKTLLEYAKR